MNVMTPTPTDVVPARPDVPRRPDRSSAFVRSISAESIKLTRRRVVVATGAAVAAVAVGGTAIGIAAAEPADTAVRVPDELITIPVLEQAGGGTALFAQTAGFMSAFLLAVLIAAVAGEFTRGTFRTMLLQQPGRFRVLAGKVTALVGFMALATLVAEVLSWITARAMAPSQDVDTSAWLSMDGLGAGLEDYGRAILFLVGTAVMATMIGVLARSVPVGVGAGLVWAGPIENIIGDSWDPGQYWFPGLLLRAVISPGSTEVSTPRALITLAIYAVIAIAITGYALRRRDVTS